MPASSRPVCVENQTHGRRLAETTKWRTDQKVAYLGWLSTIDEYVNENMEEEDGRNNRTGEEGIEELELRMRDHIRRLAD